MSMGSSKQLDADVLVGERIQPAALAEAQWVLLHALERQYIGRTVWNTQSKFEDDIWLVEEGKRKKMVVNWEGSLGTSGLALQILCKAVCFEMVTSRRLEANTIQSKFLTQRNTIIDLIEKKGLLAGESGALCLGINHITDDDLLAMLDVRLAMASSEGQFLQECSEIAAWTTMANHLSEEVPLFEFRARLPWIKSGLTIHSWAKRRAVDLGAVLREGKGYSPLVPETAMPLIDQSLRLVMTHGEHFRELGSLLRGYRYGQTYNGPPPEKLLRKYGQILGDVAAPPDIDRLASTQKKTSAVFVWIRRLLYLARGACANIILLTSGLRNGDICRLRKGDCRPSGRVDMLYYLRANIMKTKNVVVLPVPEQTQKAVSLLTALKHTESDYLLDGASHASSTYKDIREEDARISEHTLIAMVRGFAAHFNIPFIDPASGEPYVVHSYRTTVAGWLDAHSNLSVLLVRRLFGHSNDVMPTVYLRNNPSFIKARKEQKEQAAAETARQMALAASQGRLAGVKGEQLLRGYQNHVSRLEANPQKSQSLTDVELVLSFSKLIEQRIVDGTTCGFLTPFGVLCARNPVDSSQPPCAKRSHRDKTREIAQDVLQHLNDIDPANCIGTSCDQAMVGPWSEPLKESLLWYAGLVRHQHGEEFNKEEFIAHAKAFIRQYSRPISKVFHIQVLPDGSVSHEEDTKR